MTEEDKTWGLRDWLILGALFAGTFISRIPFRTTLLYAWDSVLYTRAIDSFNVALHRPQPPGHIFYVGLVWLVNRMIGDANASMVWISVFFAAAAVAALYWLGMTLFNRSVGVVAGLLLATSISFWAYSEVAYPYTLLCFLSIIVAGAIYRLWEGKSGWALPAALALGIASGFRQDLLFFMLPLLIVGLWGRSRWRILGAAVALAVSVASWYVPSALLSEGFGPYRQASSGQTAFIMEYYSVFGRGLAALGVNIITLGRFTLLALAAAAPLMALFVLSLFGRFMGPALSGRRLWFLIVWSLPSLVFYVFIHVGEYGYVFTFLPAALIAGVWGLQSMVRAIGLIRLGRLPVHIFAAVAAGLVAANLLLFLVLPTPLSAGRIAARDDILRCRLEAIRENFDPASTFIVSVYDYQQAAYYLPEFKHWNFDPAVTKGSSTGLPAGTREVVIFEEYLRPVGGYRIEICRDQHLSYMNPGPGRRVEVDWGKRKVATDNEL